MFPRGEMFLTEMKVSVLVPNFSCFDENWFSTLFPD